MKKQFFRVKQLADQTFSRAGKTEVLTDDLQEADKHVEQIRAALTGLSKRLGNPPSQTITQDAAYKEKRLKKCPEYLLGSTMLENAGEEGLMSFALSECGRVQHALASETVEHESKVEQYVTSPLQHILDTDIPNIMKHKRNLAKLILDMDSARTRYHQANKHNAGGTGATKIDNLKDELEEAEVKVEQCRDQLAAEMFQLMSRETELAQTIIQYVKLQRAYHESALHCLEQFIPELECYINNNEMKPVYGFSLEEHLRVTNRKIALPIQLCVSALLKLGMEEEGLFRIAAGTSKLRRIKLSLDACCLNLPAVLEYKDPHVIAGALKSYLRDLPEPLLTFKLYSEWMAAAKIPQVDARLRALWEVLHKLPAPNFENLRFLIKFLSLLTKNQDVNKMTPHNIAIVIAPNLIWCPPEVDMNSKFVIDMNATNNSSLIVDQLVTYADWFFPGDIDFDRDLDLGIMNGSEQVVGMRRCMSNSSLSEPGESPPQGSPKPATRRKNKPAPTPPSGTPDKHERKLDDKPPPAPDKPPRPLSTATLNRATYKAQRHEVNAELINLHHERALAAENAKRLSVEVDKTLDEEVERVAPSRSNSDPVPVENPNVERRKTPIAAPRSIANIAHQMSDETVDYRKKFDENSHNVSPVDRNSKPVIPDRPGGLTRPSSIIKQQPRHSLDSLDPDSGPLTLERAHMYSVDKQQVSIIQVRGNGTGSESNGTNSGSNLQRSPSVGHRPTSMSLSGDRPEKPPRPDVPPDQVRTHVRTKSEGNIIDVQPQEVSQPPQQPPPPSPRCVQRPPRPQPPPPPPPTGAHKKPDNESTNL